MTASDYLCLWLGVVLFALAVRENVRRTVEWWRRRKARLILGGER